MIQRYPIGMVNWNLKPILDERKITRYALSKRSGLAMGTIYAMYDNRGKQVGLETLNSVLDALRDLTGENIEIGDVLTYSPRN